MYLRVTRSGDSWTFNLGRDHFDRTMVFRPHNVYGPYMGFEHVIPQLAVRMQRAAAESAAGPIPFPIQGDGSEPRLFNNVDAFVAGLLLVIDKGEDRNIYHIGRNEEVAIRDFVLKIADQLGVEVDVQTTEIPAGCTPRRCPDISKLRSLGYEPQVSIDDGLDETVGWYAAWAAANPERAEALGRTWLRRLGRRRHHCSVAVCASGTGLTAPWMGSPLAWVSSSRRSACGRTW